MAKKYRVLLTDGTRFKGKFLTEKKAKGFVERGEARYLNRGGRGANLIEFTDPHAEADFLKQHEKAKKEKREQKIATKEFLENRKAEVEAAGGYEAWALQRYGYVPKLHQGWGWNQRKGMSQNAVAAYTEGKVPLSKINRALLDEYEIDLTIAEAKSRLEIIGPCEYHHTSNFRNRTDFYDLNALKAEIELEERTQVTD